MAARIVALAGAHEILVSQTTTDLIEGSGLELEDIGGRKLKGLSGTRRICRLVVPPDPA